MPSNSPPVIVSQPSVQITGRGLEVADGTNVRAQLGDISANNDGSSYGLKIISSDGATVIIDGTSSVFSIAATGTLTATAAAHLDTTATATLGSITSATTLAILGYVANSSSATADANLFYIGIYSDSFGSATSGGPTNLEGATTGVHGMVYNHTNGSNNPVPTLLVSNKGNPSSQQLWARYYVLQQVAL